MGKILTDVEIGGKIRTFRQQAGLTQEKLAEALEITFQQVQKYERGATKVNLAKLQQIAQVVKVPVSAFFDDSGHTVYNLSEDEIEILKAFRALKGKLRNSVIDVVAGLSKKK
jgi:transcriptional regulator with XRE-family HTH domain